MLRSDRRARKRARKAFPILSPLALDASLSDFEDSIEHCILDTEPEDLDYIETRAFYDEARNIEAFKQNNSLHVSRSFPYPDNVPVDIPDKETELENRIDALAFLALWGTHYVIETTPGLSSGNGPFGSSFFFPAADIDFSDLIDDDDLPPFP